MYVYCYIQARSYSYCYTGKSINITYFEYVFVSLGIQHAMRMRCIVICGLTVSYNIFFFNIISKRNDFLYKKYNVTWIIRTNWNQR